MRDGKTNLIIDFNRKIYIFLLVRKRDTCKMKISKIQKEHIKDQIRERLSKEQEIQKIVLFGSFVNSNNPKDIDIAIFQNSDEKYLALSLKYRRFVRDISRTLPIDIIPLKKGAQGTFLNEIETGEIIYER